MIKKRFFLKLLSAYLVLVILYTLIAAGLFIYQSNEHVNRELYRKQAVYLEQMRDQADMKLRFALTLSDQMKEQESIVAYARNPQRDYANITSIYNELQKSSNAFRDFGYRIDITKDNDDLVITPSYTITKDRYWSEMGLTPDSDEAEDMGVRRTPKPYEADTLITLTKKVEALSGSALYFYLSFHERYLLPVLGLDGESAIAILDGERLLAYKSAFQPERKDEVRDNVLPTVQSGKDGLSFRDGLSVHTLRSQVLPTWTFVYVAERFAPWSAMKEQLTVTGFVYVLLLLLGGGLAYWISRRMYLPIGNVVSLLRSDEELEEKESEERDEFKFIRDTTARMKRANVQMREAMMQSKVSLKDKLLRDLLHGLLPQERAAAELEKHGLVWLSSPSLVCVVEFASYSEVASQYTKEALVTFKSQLQLLLSERLSEEGLCEVFDFDYRRMGIMLQGDDSERAKRIVSSVLMEIEASVGLRLVAALGDPVLAGGEWERAYRQAVQWLDYGVLRTSRLVIVRSDLDGQMNDRFYYPLDGERELIGSVIRGQRENVFLLLQRLLDENRSREAIGGTGWTHFVYALQNTVNRILQQLNKILDTDEGEVAEALRKLHHAAEDAEARSALFELFERLIGLIHSEQKMLDQTQMQGIVDYVHEHYTRDLSLSEIAEMHRFSLGYISGAFKKHTGENFKDYLNLYRVKKAKEIMDTEKVKIAELALRVGCNNVNTFIRMFRKYEGISPGQYANNSGSERS